MLAEIDTQQFIEWRGFYILEPFGESWGQTARLCGEFARVMTGKLPEREAYMPITMPKDEQSPEEMAAVLMAANPGK